MMRWLSIADRGVLTLIVGLSVAAATPAPAQQAAGSGAPAVAASAGPVVPNPVAEARAAGTTSTTAAAEARAAQAGSPGAPLLGPRVRPQVQPVEPRIARGTAAWPAAPARNNTIVISTLALVLIAVIVTILVVK